MINSLLDIQTPEWNYIPDYTNTHPMRSKLQFLGSSYYCYAISVEVHIVMALSNLSRMTA